MQIGGNEILGFFFSTNDKSEISFIKKEFSQNQSFFFKNQNLFRENLIINYFKNNNVSEMYTFSSDFLISESFVNFKFFDASFLCRTIHLPFNKNFLIQKYMETELIVNLLD